MKSEHKAVLGVFAIFGVMFFLAYVTIPDNRLYVEQECPMVGFAFLAKDAIKYDVHNVMDVPPKLMYVCDDGTVRFEDVPTGPGPDGSDS